MAPGRAARTYKTRDSPCRYADGMKTSHLNALPHASPIALPLLLRGARDTLPLVPGAVAFALVYAVAARAAHVPAWLTQAMSFIIFAGSAQFAVVALVAVGAPILVIVITGAVLNLRHVLYSASLAPTLRDLPRRWRLLLAYLLTDEMFGVVVGRLASLSPAERRSYALGSGATLWTFWQAGTALGVLASAQIPAAWSLDFAAPLTFIALLVPLIRDRASALATAVTAGVAILALGAPLKLGIVLATAVGVVAGVVFDSVGSRRATPPKASDIAVVTGSDAGTEEK